MCGRRLLHGQHMLFKPVTAFLFVQVGYVPQVLGWTLAAESGLSTRRTRGA